MTPHVSGNAILSSVSKNFVAVLYYLHFYVLISLKYKTYVGSNVLDNAVLYKSACYVYSFFRK